MSFFAGNKDLDALGVKFNTNKSSQFVAPDGVETKSEGMLSKYELFLEKLRNKENVNVIELGAGPDNNIGASVRVWKEYFRDASVHVADIKESALALEQEGFHVHVGDLGNGHFLNNIAKTNWDFIIDDASHIWVHQILAFRMLFPSVKSGGIYIIEDLCTSFGRYRDVYSLKTDKADAVAYFLALSRVTCGGHLSGANDPEVNHIHTITVDDERLARHMHMISWIGNSCIVVKC